MSKKSNRIKKKIAYSLIVLIWAVSFVLLCFFAVVTAVYMDLSSPRLRFLTRVAGLETVTRQAYLDFFRPIWQHQANAMSFDEDVVYVPRVGITRFSGPDFDTRITIEPNGLRSQSLTTGQDRLIAIAGDSQAFGWGMNDEQTFSAILARKYHLNTANAAVPSYGTARELMRLRKLGILAKASIIVIQYCNNDVDENHDFVEDRDFIQKRGARALWEPLQLFKQREVSYPIVTKSTYQYLRDTVKAEGMAALFKKLLFRTDRRTGQVVEVNRPAPVMAADFVSTLDAFPELKGKTVFVLEISGWGEKTNFIPELLKLAAGRPGLVPLEVPFARSDFFRLDDHMNANGHEKVAAFLFEAIKQHP